MKRLMFVVCAAVAVLALPALAAAQPAHLDSPKVTIVVAQDLVVGTVTLLPGEYKFQCRTLEGKTFLIVSSAETGKEITRVACKREMLDGKVTESEYRSLIRPDGKRTLTVVRIKGDMVAHRIVD